MNGSQKIARFDRPLLRVWAIEMPADDSRTKAPFDVASNRAREPTSGAYLRRTGARYRRADLRDSHHGMAHDSDDRADVPNGTPPRPASLEDAIGDRVGRLFRRLLSRGRAEFGRAARSGRSQLEQRQLQKDRDHFWIRLGKTAARLVEGGELDHPALRKAMSRIDEIEARIDALKKRSEPE